MTERDVPAWRTQCDIMSEMTNIATDDPRPRGILIGVTRYAPRRQSVWWQRSALRSGFPQRRFRRARPH